MTKEFNTLVLLGRFQPFHNGHLALTKIAAKRAEQVIIIVGSADKPRTYKNPWTAQERIGMIHAAIAAERIEELYQTKFKMLHNFDTIYDDASWAARIQAIVQENNSGSKIGIIGHRKHDTQYLDMFPQWDLVEMPLVEPLDASMVRDLYFRENSNLNFLDNVVPRSTYSFLQSYRISPAYKDTIEERVFIEKYRLQYKHLPYAPIFMTVDAAVIQSGHILLVKRKDSPGRGLLALPGGFVNANTDESLQSAMIRELKEETGIKVPVPVLIGNIKGSRVFDAIDRSARGRTITQAFKIELPAGNLPKVKGSDDAEKAMWVPFSDLRSDNMFEDHREIIQCLVGV